MLWIQSMCSEMPSSIYNHSNARLFSDLMKITVVIESLSLKQSNVLREKPYQSILIQQNEASTQVNNIAFSNFEKDEIECHD